MKALYLFLIFFSFNVSAESELKINKLSILAELAVEVVKEVNGISLDYTVESLKKVDRIVLNMRKSAGTNPEPYKKILYFLGVYVGEVVIKNNENYEWAEKDLNSGITNESEFLLKSKDGIYCDPIGSVYEVMFKGQEVSVYEEYRYIKL